MLPVCESQISAVTFPGHSYWPNCHFGLRYTFRFTKVTEGQILITLSGRTFVVNSCGRYSFTYISFTNIILLSYVLNHALFTYGMTYMCMHVHLVFYMYHWFTDREWVIFIALDVNMCTHIKHVTRSMLLKGMTIYRETWMHSVNLSLWNQVGLLHMFTVDDLISVRIFFSQFEPDVYMF